MRFSYASTIAAISIMGSSLSANAADLPVKAPPLLSPVPMTQWNGFYVGLNGGGAWGSSSHTSTVIAPVSTGDFDVDGGLFGFTFGVNQQFGQWVAGLETDLDWAKVDGSATFTGIPIIGTASFSSELEWLSTVRARLGYSFGAWMPYGTAGIAIGNVKATASAPAIGGVALGSASSSETRLGWTLGVGVEYRFNPNLSGKLEYMYVDLGDANHLAVDSVKFNTNIVRVGVNYRINPLP